jgi:phospholipase/carboxylesterase
VSDVTLDGLVHVHRQPTSQDTSTLLLLHGTGATEHDLLPLGELLAPTARVLSPRGRVLERGMPRWFARHAEGVFDLEDLTRRTHELADWIGLATTAYGADPTRMVAAGFSNGANIAGALLLLRPETLRAAALFAPMLPLEPQRLPDLTHATVFVSAGRRDPICPPEQVERLARVLTDAGATVEVAWHDGGHELSLEHARSARAWLDRWRRASATDPGGVP